MPTKAFTKKTTTKKEMTKKLGKSAKKNARFTSISNYLVSVPPKNAVPAFFPKYPEYRMADLVTCDQYRDLNVSRAKRLQGYVRENETLGEYTFRLFPNSIASQYLRKTKRLSDIDVLSNIVDEFVTNHGMDMPAKDVMVMHLRVGDVIDRTSIPVDDFLNQRVNSFKAIYGYDCTQYGWSPVYVRCLASFDRALKKTKELGLNKITLVYGFHINYSTKKSRMYIAGLVDYAQSQGFEVEVMTHADADVCFAYACKAKHFIPGGGGFSKLISGVVKHKGNEVYYVRV